MTTIDEPPWRGAELFVRPGFEQRLEAEERGALPDWRVRAIRHELEHGTGVVRLAGLLADEFDDADAVAAFERLGHALGTPVSQNAAGETLLHVRDERFAADDPRVRGPHTNRELSFHTDRCDVIAFFCVEPAATGGDSHVLRSDALHAAFAARHPELLAEVEGEFPYLRHTVDPSNPRPFTMVPLFTRHRGRFAASLLRVLIDRADRAEDAPDLTARQRAALDRLEEVADDPELYASFRLARGEVLLLNNWVTFHRRTAFVDHDDPARCRHLLRLWLSMPGSRELDPRFAEHFGATEAGAVRGGIHPPRAR